MTRAFGLLVSLALLAVPSPAAAEESLVDAALRFFVEGGAYCFRLAPEGVAMAEEKTWTIMVLTSADNGKKAFRIRELEAGRAGYRGSALKAFGEVVTAVWRLDRDRAEFFERFAAGISAGRLRARVVQIQPEHLAELDSERARAELYLKFSERGARVSFDGTSDLTADVFAGYADYFPD